MRREESEDTGQEYLESYDTRDFDENNLQITKVAKKSILDSPSTPLRDSQDLFGFKVKETLKFAKEIDLASQTISSICHESTP